MHCYNHNDKVAVAVCPYCGKALCKDCGVEVGEIISCSQKCGEKYASSSSVAKKSTIPDFHLLRRRFMSFSALLFIGGIVALFFEGYRIIGILLIILSMPFSIASTLAKQTWIEKKE